MPHYNDWTSAFQPKPQLGKERAGFTPVANRNGTATVTATDGVDSLTEPSDALMETTNFDDRGYSPISGEGVFKALDIDAKGSVIVGDNHFTTGAGGDSITGEGRLTKIWTTGGPSTFQEMLDVGPVNKTADKGWWTVDGADFRDVESDFPVTNLRSENRFVIERFDPVAGMNNFGESRNPVPELGTNWCPGGSPAMTDKIGGNSGQMYSPLSGGDGCPF